MVGPTKSEYRVSVIKDEVRDIANVHGHIGVNTFDSAMYRTQSATHNLLCA